MQAKEKCGVFGVVARDWASPQDIAPLTYIGLFQLQHRGQESAGISVARDGVVITHKAMGTVDWVFRPAIKREAIIGFARNHASSNFSEIAEDLGKWEREQFNAAKMGERGIVENPLDKLHGRASIGHVRYSTTGESGSKNVHPIEFWFRGKPAAIAHNGNLIKLDRLRNILVERTPSYSFEGDTDTELIAALVATSYASTFEDAILETLPLLDGAFSLVFLYEENVYAVRDRFGIRPLCFGRTRDFHLVASESCALDALQAEFLGEVPPGFLMSITPLGIEQKQWAQEPTLRGCVFELIYFARPDSLIQGIRVHEARKALGRELAREHPIHDADVVISVPDSGNSAAIGYAQAMGKEYASGPLLDQGIVRSRIGRTFIEPVKEVRRQFSHLKHNPIPDVINGRHVVVIDDSIVRGNTMPHIVNMLRYFGARKVSVLISCPPLRSSCHLGVDIPFKEELVAHERSVEEVREIVGADYLGYLSLGGMYLALAKPRRDFCDGCMTKEYPVPSPKA